MPRDDEVISGEMSGSSKKSRAGGKRVQDARCLSAMKLAQGVKRRKKMVRYESGSGGDEGREDPVTEEEEVCVDEEESGSEIENAGPDGDDSEDDQNGESILCFICTLCSGI